MNQKASVAIARYKPKKILAISPLFPPANTPDMQRLRSALPYFIENGWEVTVAAAPDNRHSAPRDSLLLQTVPPETKVVHPKTWSESTCRKFGFGHLSYRTAIPWRREILKLLRAEKFDLIFFTTTQAAVLVNAPFWRRKSGVPYVIDLQDPIYVPGGSYTEKNAPGGYFKYRLANLLNRWVERRAFSRAGAVVSTSEHYLATLRERYPRLRQVPMATIPFGVPFRDLEVLKTLNIRNRLFEKYQNQIVVFYAGRGGPDLHPALEALFLAAARLKEKSPEEVAKLRFVFVGTSYAPSGEGVRQVVPIAEKYGVADLVTESPGRASYFEVLQGLKEADVALVLGSTRPDYTASKAFLCVAAAERTLAILHGESLLGKKLSQLPNIQTALFTRRPDEETCLGAIQEALRSVLQGRWKEEGPVKALELEKYSASAMTREILSLFEKVLKKEQ